MVEESFSYPENCTKNCEYSARWKCRKSSGIVEFELEAKVNQEEWVAIGFSEDNKMVKNQYIDLFFSVIKEYLTLCLIFYLSLEISISSLETYKPVNY